MWAPVVYDRKFEMCKGHCNMTVGPHCRPHEMGWCGDNFMVKALKAKKL